MQAKKESDRFREYRKVLLNANISNLNLGGKLKENYLP